MTLPEWHSHWQSFGVFITGGIAILGGAKLLWELAQLRRHRKEEASLARTRFFLEQHRRLFDDSDLSQILSHIDGDEPELAQERNWEKKRKFLTFMEEIALLTNSGKIKKDVAHYMFGYYAVCARDGSNFQQGIDLREEYWKEFYRFCRDYERASQQRRKPQRSLKL